MLMAAGVDTKVVGELVGHGSVAVTRVYQHVSSELARQGMSKLGELLA
jgi:site-specific recombinase XerD